MVPFPSLPNTLFPDWVMLMPPNSLEGPPLWIVKGSLELKTKLAELPGAPRLIIAITGFTTGVANVSVSVDVAAPPATEPRRRVVEGSPQCHR